MRIRVETLGSVAVTVDGEPASSLLTKPVRSAAFLYIVVERSPTRDGLIEMFWADRDPEKARRACHQMLYQLRQDLGMDWVVAAGNRLDVRAEVTTDLQVFERALADGRPGAALAVYRGSFLSDLGSVGGVAFEHWAERIRARLEREHRKARKAEIARLLERGDLAGALVHTREWVDIDPLDDEANHHRIALLARSGARDDALRCFSLYSERIRRELGVEPMDETVALVDSVRTGALEAGTPPRLLVPQSAPRAGAPPPPAAPSRTRPALAAAAILLLLLMVFRPWARPQSAMVTARVGLDPSIIAIVPFENWSGERALDAIANGLRETLALELHAHDRLVVVSNPAVRMRHDAGQSVDSIARFFNAGTLITGSIERFEGDVRVNVGVTDARGVDEYVPARVQRPDSLVHLLEADVLAEISRFLRERLGRRIELARTLPENLSREAYTLYQTGLLGLQQVRENRRGETVASAHRVLLRADTQLVRAMAHAPEWRAPVLLRGWVAREFARLHGTRDTARYRKYMSQAVAAADSVLARHPSDAEALEMRGAARMHLGFVTGDTALLRAAEADLQESAQRDDRRASTWRHLNSIALQGGNLEAASLYASRALNADPFDQESASLVARMAATRRSMGEDADEWCRRGLREHASDYRFAECFLANAAILGRPLIDADSAALLVSLADSLDASPAGSEPTYRPHYRQVLYATVLVRVGRPDSARHVMDRVIDAARGRNMERALDYDRAFFELLAGDTALARALWSRYVRQNPQFRAFAMEDPRWPPRFTERLAAAR